MPGALAIGSTGTWLPGRSRLLPGWSRLLPGWILSKLGILDPTTVLLIRWCPLSITVVFNLLSYNGIVAGHKLSSFRV